MGLKGTWHYWTQDESNPRRWENMPPPRRFRWAVLLSMYFIALFALMGWLSVRVIGEPMLWLVWAACALVFIGMFGALAIDPVRSQPLKKWFGVTVGVIIVAGVIGILAWHDYGV